MIGTCLFVCLFVFIKTQRIYQKFWSKQLKIYVFLTIQYGYNVIKYTLYYTFQSVNWLLLINTEILHYSLNLVQLSLRIKEIYSFTYHFQCHVCFLYVVQWNLSKSYDEIFNILIKVYKRKKIPKIIYKKKSIFVSMWCGFFIFEKN